MKKKISKALFEMCENLPEVKRPVKRGFTGAQMLEAGYEKDGSGNPITKDKKYTMSVMEPVNHFTICKNLFKTGGIEAVRNYCNGFLGNRPVLGDKIAELRAEQEKYSNELKNLYNGNEQFSIEIGGSTTIDAAPDFAGATNPEN